MARHSSSATPGPGPPFARELASPGALQRLTTTARGTIELELEQAAGELTVSRDGSVRLRLMPGGALPPEPGPALGRDPWPLCTLDARSRADGGFVVACGSADLAPTIEIDAKPFAVRVTLRDHGPLAVLEGFALRTGPDASRLGGGEVRLPSPPREHVFGLGEHPGALDRRGGSARLRNEDPPSPGPSDARSSSIPFLLLHDVSAGRSRGVLLDTASASFVDAAGDEDAIIRVACAYGALDVTVHPGPAPVDVLRRMTSRVGRMALPPRWALGHHYVHGGRSSARSARRAAEALRRHAIPTDALHLDVGALGGGRILRLDAQRFAEPGALVDALQQQGLRTVATLHPGVWADERDPLYVEARERALLCTTPGTEPFHLRLWPGAAALPDLDRSEVREWWAGLHAPLLESGLAGLRLDSNAPGGWTHDLRLGRSGRPLARYGAPDWATLLQRSLGALEDGKEDVPHESVRNVYALQHCRASRMALERARPGERPFLLSSSGCPGIQRLAASSAGGWRVRGARSARFDDLQESVRAMLGLSVSGVALCGADVGESDPELFARWMQIGALQPLVRTRARRAARGGAPWRTGGRTEQIVRRALALRMRLVPYLYSLLHEAAETGAPIWRPLFLEFPHDGESVFCEDQVMIGPLLMAAPVLERGARSREVYLPPGVWLDWYDDARHVGPKRLRVPAPMERIPLFVRGGAAIPTQSAEAHTGAHPREPLVVEVAPGADGAFTLVEDDGLTSDGPTCRTRMRTCDRRAGRFRLEIAHREGEYDVGERGLRVCLRGFGAPSAVRLGGDTLVEGHIAPAWRIAQGRVHVRLRDAGELHTLEIEPAP